MDADGLRKAMKGFGTDEKALIHILANKDPHQMALIRQVYNQRHHRTLEADIASETGGHLEDGLLALVRGPLQQDVYLLNRAMSGPGTKEAVLNDVLLARSNADMAAIKSAYQRTYHHSLESAVRSDLSMKTERHFMMVLAGNRAEDSAPVVPQQVDQDVLELYKATEGKVGTDELLVCSILTTRNDAQIRAISHAYQAKFSRDLEIVIKKVGFLPFPPPLSLSNLSTMDTNVRQTGILRPHGRCPPLPTPRRQRPYHA
jgi:annexin A7/11